jgi:hypothetical protein
MRKSTSFLPACLSLLLLLLGCCKKDDASSKCIDSVLSNNITDPDLLVLQPNGISPNGDGRNDRLVIVVRSKSNPQNQVIFSTRRLQVTRPGSTLAVYSNPNYNNDFDGHDTAGKELAEGDYLYELTLDNYLLKGSVKIVRSSSACSCRALDPEDPKLVSTVCQ